jgi:chromosome segregation ATPase
MFQLILSETSFLPEWLQTIATDLGVLWPIVLFVGAAYGLVKWISKKFRDEVRDLIIHEVEPIKSEFKNNGGSSFRDAIDRLDTNYEGMKDDIRDIHGDVTHLKSDIDHIKSDLDGIAEKSAKEHKNLSEKIGKIEAKNDSIWDEIQKRRPAYDAYEAQLKKNGKIDF